MIQGLTLAGCQLRQQRLRDRLAEKNIEAALLMNPRNVHYLTGYWRGGQSMVCVATLIATNGPSILITSAPPDAEVAADQSILFSADRLCTLIDDQPTELMQVLRPHMENYGRIGCDRLERIGIIDNWQVEDLNDTLLSLKRSKDPDEVQILRDAIAASDAAYRCAKQMLQPGVTELEIYAQMQAAAIEALGEPITGFGTDFRSGEPGGLPRTRSVESGELAIYDISVVARGYSSDLCRTFTVNSEPTMLQREAHQLVIKALDYVEATVRPGISCKQLYNDVYKMLDVKDGWRFFHHLGHGIGLMGHEAPRLNPNWDDTFQVHDVFTAEPGVYGDELRAGIRLEQNYLVTESGIERLSHFPLDL